jgi:hypothetical protein
MSKYSTVLVGWLGWDVSIFPRPVNLTGYAIVVAQSVANRYSYTRGKDSGDLKRLAGLTCRKPNGFEGSKEHPRDRVPLTPPGRYLQ